MIGRSTFSSSSEHYSYSNNATAIIVIYYPPPSFYQNGIITRYVITIQGTPFNSELKEISIPVTTPVYPLLEEEGHIFTQLHAYNTYYIRVTAVNSIGAGPTSPTFNISTLQSVYQPVLLYSPLNCWVNLPFTSGKFTAQIFTSFRHTCEASSLLVTQLTDNCGYQYLLTARIQNDPLEHHFGLYRQMSGSKYQISFNQIVESERRLQLSNLLKVFDLKYSSASVFLLLKTILCAIYGVNKVLPSFSNKYEDCYAEVEEDVTFTFNELSFLYRDTRSLEYLVRKNKEDKDLKDIYDLIQRQIRHYYDNRIDIPSFAIDTDNYLMWKAPPKEERNIPVASGVDRGGVISLQLDTPAGIIAIKDNVIVTDRYGDTVSLYRADDLVAYCSYHDPHSATTPVSLTYFKQSLFVCYTSSLVQFSLTWEDSLEISHMDPEHTISIPQACCTSSNSTHLYVGTLKPSLIRMQVDLLCIE
ncbi:hypothetical protein LOD99_2099 [Oopsacas minuta]|uniref:Fibronectin type-III domain-containing protein n=1 Tax=Oopsacas minuta TaxID=111878 RepID=A0AAV7K5J8_9METZ|nr:hypothetical protein LOD99_2099 [Oopsacas minuta]